MKSIRQARSTPSEAQNLTVRYGEIGISAVAAAMQYHSKDKAVAEASTERGQPQNDARWHQSD